MRPTQLIFVYCVFIAAASLAGGKLPSLVRLTHARMQSLVSLVGGLMLGVGLFHLLPHAAVELPSLDQAVWWTMVGLLSTFFLIRAFHFHQHGSVEEHETHAHSASAHDHDCGQDHHDEQPANHAAARHRFSWLGIGLGLSIHTLIDGSALAASVEAESHGNTESLFLGMGTFLAVLLHKPLDSMSITSLMAAGGWSTGWRRGVNLAYALMCPLGALSFWMGIRHLGNAQQTVVGCALAFSAGVFLCISLGDLLPEVQFHSHDRLKLSACLLLGVTVAWFIRYLEPAHAHAPHRGHRHARSSRTSAIDGRFAFGKGRPQNFALPTWLMDRPTLHAPGVVGRFVKATEPVNGQPAFLLQPIEGRHG
jgi:zinc and cadmium transporter